MIKNEINELLNYNYKIIQNSEYFKYSLDSVILADFVNIDYKDKKLMDLCTGNAPIPIILSGNKKLDIFGMELQKEIFDLAAESLKINNINNVNLINDNIKNIKNYFPGNNFDIITCNPPYFKYNTSSIINDNKIKSIARHEIEISLQEIIKIASENLRFRGKFYMIHRTERLFEIFDELHKNHFGIKKIQFIYNNQNSNCSMFVLEAK